MVRRYVWALALVLVFAATSSPAKVYKNIKVGEYQQGASFHINDCKKKGYTFLKCMMEDIYPAMNEQAKNQKRGGQHIDGVKNGEGVELRLTSDVTTYHVKYKADTEDKAERSGRSFGAVGKPNNAGVVAYVADASDAYYLDSLEEISQDENELREFYVAILEVITKCDAKGFSKLNTKAKQVAADFVAVYVAEEYRHLIGGKGKLGKTFKWDDALLQVTLLASFHSGQAEKNGGMFYEGEFTDEVYNQVYYEGDTKVCFYRQKKHPARGNYEKRANILRDYWQMNRECKRSGINLTRTDFNKMAKAVTEFLVENDPEAVKPLAKLLGKGTDKNVYSAIAKYLINNDTPGELEEQADELVDAIVPFLMTVREHADDITSSLKH